MNETPHTPQGDSQGASQQAGYQQYAYQQAPATEQGQPVGRSFFDWIRSWGIQRSQNRWIGGVSGAISYKLGWDPLIVRIIWLALAFAGGIGVMLYGVAWMLLPDERDGRILAQSAIEDGDLSSSFWGALIFIIIGCPVSAPISLPALIVIAIVLALLYHKQLKEASKPKAPGAMNPGNGFHNGNPAGNAPGAANTAGFAQPTGFSQPASNASATAYGTGYGASPNAAYGAPAGAATVTAAPAPQVKHKRRKAGAAIVGTCAGIIVLALGIVLLAYGQTGSPWNYAPNGVDITRAVEIWAVASVAFLGIALILIGMAGRRGGGLTALAIVMLVIAMCTTGIEYSTNYTAIAGIAPQHAAVQVTESNATYRSADFNNLVLGTSAKASNVTIDLTDWSTTHSTACPNGTLPLWATASNVIIRIPASCKAVFSDSEQSSFVFLGALSGADYDGAYEDDSESLSSQLNSLSPSSSTDASDTADTAGTSDSQPYSQLYLGTNIGRPGKVDSASSSVASLRIRAVVVASNVRLERV